MQLQYTPHTKSNNPKHLVTHAKSHYFMGSSLISFRQRIVPTVNLQDYTKQSAYRIVPSVNLQGCTNSQLTGLYQTVSLQDRTNSQLTGLYQQSTYRIVPTVDLQDCTNSQLTGLYQQSTYRIVPTVNLEDNTKQSTYRIIPNSQLTGLYQQSTSYRKRQFSFDLYLIHILENVHQYCLLSLTSSHLSVVTSATTGINQPNHRSAKI